MKSQQSLLFPPHSASGGAALAGWRRKRRTNRELLPPARSNVWPPRTPARPRAGVSPSPWAVSRSAAGVANDLRPTQEKAYGRAPATSEGRSGSDYSPSEETGRARDKERGSRGNVGVGLSFDLGELFRHLEETRSSGASVRGRSAVRKRIQHGLHPGARICPRRLAPGH